MASVQVIRDLPPKILPIKEVILTLSEQQARLILSVCRRIGGQGPDRKATDDIATALQEAGFVAFDNPQKSLHDGSLYVKGGW